MEKMTYLNEAQRDGVRPVSILAPARSRRPRVERGNGCDHAVFAPFADPAPDGALCASGSYTSMRL